MKTIAVILGIITTLGLMACNLNSKAANDLQSTKQAPENFKDFYEKFLTDEEFQLSRINFPLEGEIIDEDIEITGEIEETDWEMLTNSIYEVDTDEYQVEIKEDADEVFHRVYIQDSGVDIIEKYKRIKGKWYLVYYKSIFI
ncbi:DUF4348 domain-containing protein [Prevotella sp. 10(H)]|uniref:DUF4348 domain-containing protein n=1 Tax=Prevotella sp. 10(H) TaxID=1158294 RepID=UPI0004A6EE44|nr:DUF4348 domain-containing protein [Prevotella sp. 10(H)]